MDAIVYLKITVNKGPHHREKIQLILNANYLKGFYTIRAPPKEALK